MNSVEFRGEPGDLERFAQHVLKRQVSIDVVSQFEHRMRWDAHTNSGSSSSCSLRSGIKLNVTHLSWAEPWAFQFRDAATPLKFLLGHGPGPRITPSSGRSYRLGEGRLRVRHSRAASNTTCEFVDGGAECHQLALEIDPKRLKELLGAPALPAVLETMMLVGGADPDTHEQGVSPAVFRVVEELLHVNARASSRQIFVEAKALELLALLVDDLELSAPRSPFGQRDLEQLECARRLLLQRMAAPPSLRELARHAGLNEVKLKTGFRSVFGNSVFGYLRAERMELARRLLVERGLSVTEVALRVGYENPSKFASAFRKHFGFMPSALR